MCVIMWICNCSGLTNYNMHNTPTPISSGCKWIWGVEGRGGGGGGGGGKGRDGLCGYVLIICQRMII